MSDKAVGLLASFKQGVDAHAGGAAPRALIELQTQLKLTIMGFPSLSAAARAPSHTLVQEVSIAREALEYATFLSTKAADTRTFELHIAQVKAYYRDFKTVVPPSPNQHLILGLNLLHLLVENRLAEFHCELELVDEADRTNGLIAYPVMLEEWLMEGSYNKVLSSFKDSPSPYFTQFMQRLVDTVRDEIAECSSSSYDVLSLDSLQRMMMLSSRDELLAYIAAKRPTWRVDAGVVHFMVSDKARVEVPAMALIGNLLSYATELERIV